METFQITDSTTRDELVSRVNDLEEEIQKLETKIEDKNQEIEDLRLIPVQLNRLNEAADEAAACGRIHNTPFAKREWVEGR